MTNKEMVEEIGKAIIFGVFTLGLVLNLALWFG